ncbi:MAG: DUF11 domain-containing protein [Solirubrobacterales bacterium]|nr:DUF11 domain-containing protein [Solirubrobacterales bacterium]
MTDRPKVLLVLGVLIAGLVLLVGGKPAIAEQSESMTRSVQAGKVAVGGAHACAVLDTGAVRCWGSGINGRLGYANTNDIGDNETPASAGPVDLGAGRSAVAVTAGLSHTCAVLDNGTVRCWGNGGSGRLGYGTTASIGDDETPGSVGQVDLGAGRTAVDVVAGASHTCALLDNGTVRCWGDGFPGQLGYGNTNSIGDNESPASAGPVDLGAGRTAVALTAGDIHTCALLDNGTVRCWGSGASGKLGYGNTSDIGDDETPGTVGPVDLGAGRRAVAISAGSGHTCVVLDTGAVRCWGSGANGRLGYGNTTTIGDTETPGSVGPVDIGTGRSAVAITAGLSHTCALLDNGTVRCWGSDSNGRLGNSSPVEDIGDNETPGAVGPVDLGSGLNAVAVAAGDAHSCAVLDSGALRCWGFGGNGRLGYGNTDVIGDNETPASVGPLNLGGSLVATVADLSGSASASLGRVDVGGNFSVRFDVSNSGPDTAAGVTSQVNLPAGTTAGASSLTRGNFNSTSGVWSVGSLGSGQSASLKIQMTANAAGSLQFASAVSGQAFDPAAANDKSSIEVTAGSLAGPTGPTGDGQTGPTGPVGPSRLGVALSSTKFTGKRKKKLTLRYAATESAKVSVRLLKGKKTKAKASGKARQGANTLKVKLPKKPGKYKIELKATAGSVTAKAQAKLVVRK